MSESQSVGLKCDWRSSRSPGENREYVADGYGTRHEKGRIEPGPQERRCRPFARELRDAGDAIRASCAKTMERNPKPSEERGAKPDDVGKRISIRSRSRSRGR